MSTLTVIFYQEANGACPVLDFLRQAPACAQKTATDRLRLLKTEGHRLRRPHADYLRDGIYELRWRTQRVHYRILYTFHGRSAVLLTNALTNTTALENAPRRHGGTEKRRSEGSY